MNNIKGTKHNHAEAFCHMLYHGKAPNGSQITLSIWNSRDGVTPFMLTSEEYGICLQHINWHHDRYDPNYKPRKGDFIWRNFTEKDAKDLAQNQIDCWLKEKAQLESLTDEQYKQLYKSSLEKSELVEQLASITADPGRHIEETVKRLLMKGEPFFELVTEDWK
jgi:hypothetical protein